MIRWVTGLCVTFLILLSISASLLLTPTGLNITLMAAKKYLPGKLHYSNAEGVLIGPIDITGLTYDHDGVSVRIGTLHLQWRALAILQGRFTASEFNVDNLNITIKKQHKKASQSTSAPTLHLPLALRFDEAHFTNIVLHQPDIHRTVQLDSFSVQDFNAQNQLSGKANIVMLKPYPLKLSLILSGNFSDYHFKAKASNDLIDGILIGSGNAEQAQCSIKMLHTSNGTLGGTIALQWAPQVQWKVDLTAKELNAHAFNPNWPKQLSFDIQTQGLLKAGSIPVFTINSTMTTPDNTVYINGSHNKKWSLSWKINALNLSTISSTLTGDLASDGKITGPTRHPQIKGQLKASVIAFENYHAEHLQSSWDIDFSEQRNALLLWSMKNVDLPFSHLNEFKFRGDHQSTGQRTHLHFLFKNDRYGANRINSTFYGTLKQSTWTGVVTELSLNSHAFGNWQLKEAPSLKLSFDELNTTPFCWQSAQQSICLSSSWKKNKDWNLQLNGKRLSGNHFITLIEPLGELDQSTLDLDFSSNGDANAVNTANLEMKLTSGKLKLDPLRKKKINFNGATLRAQIKSHTLNTELNANPSKNETIDLQATLPWERFEPFFDKPIKGSVSIQTKTASLLNALTPNSTLISGKLQGKASIAGTLNQPKINGKMSIASGGIKLPALRIELKNPTIGISTDGEKTKATLATFVDDQPLTAKGEGILNFPNQSSGNIIISGDNLKLLNSLEYKAYATPHLTVAIHNNTIKTSGSILIPEASLQPVEFGGTTSLPSDVVFKNKNGETNTSDWEFLTDIKVTLGDKVTVDTNGLKAKLIGGVNITKTSKGQDTVGNGTIHILDGNIDTRGHRLTIKPSSTIAFINSPISNPNLDITVVRVINSVTQIGASAITVGVYIQGNVTNPKVTFFSYPAHLSQADILSFLILGHSSSANSAADITTLLQSIDFFHVRGKSSSGLMNEVTQGLGLSEFGVQSGTTLDALGTPVGYNQSSFVVGRYLTRHIYLRYVTDLDYDINVFQLRYIFNPSWLVQTESSTLGNGGDILYTIQRPKDEP